MSDAENQSIRKMADQMRFLEELQKFVNSRYVPSPQNSQSTPILEFGMKLTRAHAGSRLLIGCLNLHLSRTHAVSISVNQISRFAAIYLLEAVL